MLSTKNSNLHSNKDPSLLKNNSNTTNIDPHVRTMHRYLTRSKAARHYQARQSILEQSNTVLNPEIGKLEEYRQLRLGKDKES